MLNFTYPHDLTVLCPAENPVLNRKRGRPEENEKTHRWDEESNNSFGNVFRNSTGHKESSRVQVDAILQQLARMTAEIGELRAVIGRFSADTPEQLPVCALGKAAARENGCRICCAKLREITSARALLESSQLPDEELGCDLKACTP